MSDYGTMADRRTPEETRADRIALVCFTPGARVRHATYRHWRAVVIRTFVDDAGEWTEHQDDRGNVGAGRPRHWEIDNGD